MSERSMVNAYSVLAGAALFAFTAGCGSDSAPSGTGAPSTGGTPVADEHGDKEGDGHNLDGWWCSEHGVPEGECAQCNSDLIAQFKADGDWCEKHNRPESQCFLCDPSRFEKFAARYEANFGKRPPPAPTE